MTPAIYPLYTVEAETEGNINESTKNNREIFLIILLSKYSDINLFL
jgi:hypothetical protein